MKKLILTLLILVLCFASCKKEVKTEEVTTTATDTIKTKEPIAEEPLDSVAEKISFLLNADSS